MPRLSINFDKATQAQMELMMQDFGFKTKSSFIINCVKVALIKHQNNANFDVSPNTHTRDSNLSKERIYYAESSTLPQKELSVKNNNSKKTPPQPLDPNWQPPTHLRHKFCTRWGLVYTEALEMFKEMAKEAQSTSRCWDSTWVIKCKKGVLRSVKPVDTDDDYMKPEETMAFQLAR